MYLVFKVNLYLKIWMVEPAVVVQKIVIGKQYAFSDEILFKLVCRYRRCQTQLSWPSREYPALTE